MSQIDPALGNYIPIEEFAAMVGKCRRTVSRWIARPDGLPHLPLGNETHIPITEAREWLAARIKRPNPRRRAS